MNRIRWLLNAWRYYVGGWDHNKHQCPGMKYLSHNVSAVCQRCKHHPGECHFIL